MNILYFYLFEAGSIISLFLILFRERENIELLEHIVLALIYGLILEILNVHLSNSYQYGNEFFLQIYNIPISIAAGWAIIYYAAHNIAKNYLLKWWQSGLLMAIIALSFDIAMDAIATRIGFWTWRIPLSEEVFGVPYDNFLGWMAVIWTFSFFINLSRQKYISEKISKTIKYSAVIISPLLLSFQITLYATFSALISGKFTIIEIAEYHSRKDFGYAYYPEVQRIKAYIFASIILILAIYLFKTIYSNRKKIANKLDFFSFSILTLTYIFFLSIYIIEKIYKAIPWFSILALGAFFFHLIISLYPKKRH